MRDTKSPATLLALLIGNTARCSRADMSKFALIHFDSNLANNSVESRDVLHWLPVQQSNYTIRRIFIRATVVDGIAKTNLFYLAIRST